MSGHFLKLHFCMFEKSQGNHDSLDCHNFFGNIFHKSQSLHVQSLTQIKFFLHVRSIQTSKMNNLYFFQMSFSFTKCAPFLLKIGKDFNIND